MNIFNKIFYNKDISKKRWHITGVETNPNQTEQDDNIDIQDKLINLTISKEKGTQEVIATINVDDKEYSFIMYDEIIDFIKKLKAN